MKSTRLKKQRKTIYEALEEVIGLCEESIRDGKSISEHVDFLIEGSIQAGVCNRTIEICEELRDMFGEGIEE